jgi:hypothetical protein
MLTMQELEVTPSRLDIDRLFIVTVSSQKVDDDDDDL